MVVIKAFVKSVMDLDFVNIILEGLVVKSVVEVQFVNIKYDLIFVQNVIQLDTQSIVDDVGDWMLQMVKIPKKHWKIFV